jgi:hypothetical protein
MPTILFVYGWRFFFYSNEKNEPIHIHCQKAEKECKFWLDENKFDIIEAYMYNMKPRDFKIVRRAIFENFDFIVSEWKKFKNGE